ncbi:MAG: LysR substrate-binding domain-containing protein [Rhizobiaceae bacterium]|nr:LysR substrate-binding domain-containing protein [Rhizobiaceae bacterium]
MRMRQLEAFRATILSGSVSRAALMLKTSQPTLSRLLSELEHSVGFPLFNRQRGRIEPTEEGLDFYQKLDEVYSALSHLRNSADEIRKDRTNRLKISGSSALATALLPPVLARFSRERPTVQVSLHAQTVPELFRTLLKSEADLVFSNRLGGIQDSPSTILTSANFVCVLPPGHPLGKKKEIGPQDLKGEPVIRLEDADNLGFTQHDRLAEKYGWWQHANVATQISNVAYSLVYNGLGIGLLEPFSAPAWQKCGLLIRPFRPRLRYDFTVSMSPNPGNRNLCRELVDIAREYILELDLDSWT